MHKRVTLIRLCVLMACVFLACSANAAERVDPYLNLLVRDGGIGNAKDAVHGEASSNIHILARTSDPDGLKKMVHALGGRVHTVKGNIVTIEAPASAISRIIGADVVEYAEAAKPLDVELDKSINAINAVPVQHGQFDGVAYDGKGVIIGVVDTGIDWSHSVFSDADGNSRIISIWDQDIDGVEGFTAPKEIEDSYGIECLRKNIEDKTCPSKDIVGHGTHVAGIAAGRDAQYGGVAPGAELIVVKASHKLSGTFSTSLIDAVDYIVSKAEQEGKPVVINISLGTDYGAHDGTSLLEQALDAKIDEAPGRAIVAAAGNSNRQRDDIIASVHASTALQGDECRFEFLGFSATVHSVFIDVWQREGAALTFGVGVDTYGSYEETGLVAEGSSYDQILDGGHLRVVVDSTDTANPENGKKHSVIYIAADESETDHDISIDKYGFDFIVSGNGAFDAWIMGGAKFTKREGTYLASNDRYCPGDSRRTVGIPATAREVLSVASFASRSDFGFLLRDGGVDYNFTPVNELSPFSSPGPSADSARTGQKPEITAPGEWIISALSYDAINSLLESGAAVDGDREHVAMAGTSMASPHVAGAVALMLQRKPDLTAGQIKMLLARNADAVNVVPNNYWGFGKLDVAAIFTNFDSTDLQTPLPVSDEEVAETPFAPQALPQLDAESPSSGSGGCALVGKLTEGGHISFGLCLLALSILAVARSTKPSRRAMIFIVLMSFLAACGGASPTPTETSFDQTVSLTNSYIKIDVSRMIAYVSMWNAENTIIVELEIPLRHFYRNETIQMSADNFYTFDADRATLLIINAKDIRTLDNLSMREAIANSSGAWLSTSGTVTIDESSVAEDGKVQLQIADAEMRPLDRASLMINREGDAKSFSMPFVGEVSEGVGAVELVTDANPLNGNIGTKVQIRGFNFTEDTQARFCGCLNHVLPVELKSENELEVTISAYCDNSTMEISNGYYFQCGREPAFIFDDAPDLWISPLPYPAKDLLKVVHEPATDYIFMLFKPGNQLEVYSINDKAFLASKPLPVPADTFDLVPDGTLITAKGKDITIVASDGAVQAQAVIPQGDFVGDVAIGPGQKVLLINYYQGWAKPSDVCVLDRSNMTVVCPSELYFYQGYSGTVPAMTTRADRRLVVGISNYYFSVYRFDDNGTIQKIANGFSFDNMALHPLRDEIWIGDQIDSLDLSKIKNLKGATAYPSPGGKRYYAFQLCDIGIFTDDNQQEELSYSSCGKEEEDYWPDEPQFVAVSDDDHYLTVIWNGKIRQVDLSQINAYLDVGQP